MTRVPPILLGVTVGALLLSPAPVGGWGCLSSPTALSDSEMSTLRNTLPDYATNRARYQAEFDGRLGPHPIHQFIALKAFQLLERDPAFKDGKSGFPDIKAINAWDGIVRTSRGMAKRSNNVPAISEWLDPPVGAFSGPAADAELTVLEKWSDLYCAQDHYWNPWLNCGGAPLASATNYIALRRTIATGEPKSFDVPLEVEKAQYAHYLAHYVSDVASAKHADAIAIPVGALNRLEKLAEGFPSSGADDLATVFNIPEVVEAANVIRRVAVGYDATNGAKLWRRWNRNIARDAVLDPARSGLAIEVGPASVRSAVAVYLRGLATRPPEKNSYAFYNFFDPFYFNGQVLDTANDLWSLEWGLGTPFCTHLFWETNPEQGQFARRHAGKKVTELRGVGLGSLGAETPEADYQPFKMSAEFNNITDDKKRNDALRTAMADLVKHCSVAAHGTVCQVESPNEFNMEFKTELGIAIQHVFTAFRASITALRVDAKLVESEVVGRTYIKCELYNLAKETATLDRISLDWDPPGVFVRTKGRGTKAIKGSQLKPGERIEVGWEIEPPEHNPMPEFSVELCGHYNNTPDSGWHRAKVEGGLSIVYGPEGAGRRVPKGAPVDLIVVFDITGSMGGAIDSCRKRAEALIRSLREEKEVDLRLGLVGFRDHDDDEAPPFDPQPLTSSVDRLIRWMNDWEAKGGGDTPEDQYAALMRAIKMKWDNERKGKKVTKLIVVITDAPAKRDPVTGRDFEGNNASKVAAAAEAVDPAHIYPIVVGTDAQAIADGEELAELTGGKFLSAASGEEVADALLEAVETGIEEHAEPVAPTGPGSRPLLAALLLLVGIAAIGVGLAFALTRGRNTCPHCGRAIRASATFCTSCGAELGARRCPNPQCGQEMLFGKEFCTACGTRVAQPPQA
ncbi:MAG: zinc-ribbon domain-containing protein [Armatimonadota bacterium]